MARRKWLAAFLMTLTLVNPGLEAAAQQVGGTGPAPEPERPLDREASFLIHVQSEFQFRISGSSNSWDHQTPFLLGWNIVGMKWDRRHSTWGLGVRGAIDDFGFRAGPVALWRTPLGPHPGAYFQASTGCYLFAGSGDLNGKLPGYFLAAEIAPGNLMALSLGVETLQYQYYSYDPTGIGGYGSWLNTSSTRCHMGLKFGQWAGVTTTALLFGVAAVAVAGMNN